MNEERERLDCCVATMAYNEEANIGQMLEAVLSQRLQRVHIAEIVVIASGCTDRTEEIVGRYAARDSRVRLLVQPSRRGKSSAINLLLQHTRQNLVALVNADAVPAPNTLEHLIAPFSDPEVGMTGGCPVPTNDAATFMGYAVHLLWTLHHHVCRQRPKMGELIAFRRFFHQIPAESAVDEASIEPLIRGQGLQLHYVPEARVYIHGPETVRDFLRQRRRIYAGHLYVRGFLGYRVSTLRATSILWLLLTAPGIKRDWHYFCWGPAVMALEAWSRFLGFADYHVWKRRHTIWEVAETTKIVPLPSLSGPPGSNQ